MTNPGSIPKGNQLPPGHTASGALRTGECNQRDVGVELPTSPAQVALPAFRRVNAEPGGGEPQGCPFAEGAEGFAPCFVERLCLSGRILRNIMVFRRVNPPVARPVQRRADGFTRRKNGLIRSGGIGKAKPFRIASGGAAGRSAAREQAISFSLARGGEGDRAARFHQGARAG